MQIIILVLPYPQSGHESRSVERREKVRFEWSIRDTGSRAEDSIVNRDASLDANLREFPSSLYELELEL